MSRTQLLLVLFLVAMSAKDGHGFQSTMWTRETPLRNVSLVVTATSPLECARQCSQTSGCVNFCVDESNSLCYFDHDDDAPSLVTDTSGLTCYNQTYYASSYNVQQVCPLSLGYLLLEGRCVKLVTSKLTYDDAQNECNSDDAHLYYYKSSTEDGPAISALLAAHGLSTGLFWLGANDIASEGDFFWSDGTPLFNNQSTWVENEPDNNNGNEDCVGFKADHAGIKDAPCISLKQFVCQVDL